MGVLDGKVALITGGGSGIGRAVARRYSDEGAQVSVLDVSNEKLSALKQEIPGILTIEANVTSLEDNDRAVAQVVSTFGRLDILVPNAGVADNFLSIQDLIPEKLGSAFDELFGVNVKGYVFSVKAALSELIKNKGRIIFTASLSSTTPGYGGTLYVASKHAVAGLVKALAYDLAPQVRVNGVAPGYVHTGIRGIQVLGQGSTVPPPSDVVKRMPLDIAPEPEDVAGIYLFLASDDSKIMTGTIVLADAGVTIRGRKW